MAAIGIDLGSTYSCAAVWREIDDKIEEKTIIIPSYVAFTPKGRLFGNEARDYSVFDPQNTVFNIPRIMGRRFDDLQLQMDMHLYPFYISSREGWPVITVDDAGRKVTYTPQQIAAMIIFRLKELVEEHTRTVVTKVVLTVPPFFNDKQREGMREAGVLAGLDVLRMTNDCTAAAIALKLHNDEETNIIVYDLGGTMVTVSVLAMSGSIYEVNDSVSNMRLGGNEFDSRILAYFAEDFKRRFNVSVHGCHSATKRLRIASEDAKREFSDPNLDETTVEIPKLCEGHDYEHKLTREMFNGLCTDLFKDTLKLIDKILEDNELLKADIKKVILMGGGGKIVLVKRVVEKYFEERIQLSTCPNPDELAARGAAIQAAILDGSEHATIKHKVLSDKVPLSLGIEVSRGIMLKMIMRNQSVPCTANMEIPTMEDFIMEQTVKVYEGEREVAEDNHFLVDLRITDLKPSLRGVEKILVGFDVDYSGILRVFARKAPLGKLAEEIVNPDVRVKPDDVDLMVATAELFRDEDLASKERLEARFKLESFIFDVKRRIHAKPDLLNSTEKASMREELETAIKWFELSMDCPKDEFIRKFNDLSYRWVEITDKIFDQKWIYRPILR